MMIGKPSKPRFILLSHPHQELVYSDDSENGVSIVVPVKHQSEFPFEDLDKDAHDEIRHTWRVLHDDQSVFWQADQDPKELEALDNDPQ